MRSSVSVLSVLCLALAGCGSKDAPTGQVVATVDGVEITQSELNAELGGRRAPNAEAQKQLQQAVLEQMIARVLLAKAAKDQKVDQTPEGAVAKQRAEQTVMINLLESKLGKAATQVAPEEVEQFISSNPDLFANRRIYLVDQIIVPSPSPQLLKALEPLNTMDEVRAELAKNSLPNNIAMGTVDSLSLGPDAAKQIAGLAPNTVFIIPSPGAVRINHVRETQSSPITGEDATRVGRELLVRTRASAQVQNGINAILREGRAKVQYNAAFKPAAAPKGGQPAPAGAAKVGE